MTGYVPQEKIEEIRDRIDIVHLISEYVALRKAGRNFIGLCPFHKEKTPSFSVRPDKQIFYCFGCGIGGNVFSFLMNINGMTFPEAVRYLAGKTGVVLPEAQYHVRSGEQATEREQVYLANRKAAEWFAKNLAVEGAARVRAYLGDRGMHESVIEAFHLGYAPDKWSALRTYFERDKTPLEQVEKAGLIIKGKEGTYYDRFRGRLMIPIEDTEGRIIAFGGRVLGSEEPKYLNSPESPVYIKGRHLYGLNRSKEFIRKEGYAILVEGYFDFLALWNAGIHPVVASLGTALTREQVDLIRRYAQKVYVTFDPDEAGRKALIRSMEIFLAADLDAWAVSLPQGLDPDSCIRTYGKEGFQAALDAAQPIETYFLDQVVSQEKTVAGEKQAVKAAIDLSRNIVDPIARNLFLRRIAERFGVEYEIIKRQVLDEHNALVATDQRPPLKGQIDALRDQADKLELTILHLMLENPRRVRDVKLLEVLDYFADGEVRAIASKIMHSADESGDRTVDMDGIIHEIENPAIRDTILHMVMAENMIPDDVADRMFLDTVNKMRSLWFKKRHRNLQTKLIKAQRDGDEALCLSLMKEKENLIREEKKTDHYKDRHHNILQSREIPNG
ncbi:MAG: DNA primase [Syntrophaceae bacterium]|nr:DNA primase [Syntrophaceae bacterium]